MKYKQPVLIWTLLFLSIVCISITSCCTKKKCKSIDYLSGISFYNFTPEEVDTIVVLSYVKNTNFKIQVDSLLTYTSQSINSYYGLIGSGIKVDLDYKIKIISIGKTYTLTGFELERVGCNTCFPYRPKDDFYDRLKSYLVNGMRQMDSQISIYK